MLFLELETEHKLLSSAKNINMSTDVFNSLATPRETAHESDEFGCAKTPQEQPTNVLAPLTALNEDGNSKTGLHDLDTDIRRISQEL